MLISTCTLPHKHCPVAMPAGALPNAFTVARLMSHLREDYSVPQEDVFSATVARITQP
jgi:hypothetical protein